MNKYLVHIEHETNCSHLEISVEAYSFEISPNDYLIFIDYDAVTCDPIEIAIFKKWTFVKKIVD